MRLAAAAHPQILFLSVIEAMRSHRSLFVALGWLLAGAPAWCQGDPDSDFGSAADASGFQTGRSHQGGSFDWALLNSFTTPRSRPGGEWLNGKFYLIGGETTGGGRADRVEIFDPVTASWSASLSSMPIPVSNIMGATAFAGPAVFVFGGWDFSNVARDEVQIYNTQTDTWSISPHRIPISGRYGMLAENIGNGVIFACGGYNGSSSFGDSFRFHPNTGFSTDTPMPTPRYHLTGTVSPIDGRVYAVAGFGSGAAFAAYDPATSAWSTLPNIPTDRAGCGVIAHGPYVLLFGGNWNAYYNTTELYNIQTGAWVTPSPLPTMNLGRRSFAYGKYESPQGAFVAAFAAGGWRGSFMSDVEALH